jgi:hypothetical protein
VGRKSFQREPLVHLMQVMKIILLILSILCCLPLPAQAGARCEAVPEKGLQPEVVVSSDGTVHLVYLRGDPQAAEVRYTWRKAGEAWHPSLTVNTIAGSAIAIGTIRGPQLALGKNGTVHVLWNGTATGKLATAPLWYARKPAEAEGFAKQQNLLGESVALDGGASITASADGKVYVVWHGLTGGAASGEKDRLIFLRTSPNDGASFPPAEVINSATPGICACCSLRVTLSTTGEPNILVRTAMSADRRPMSLYAHSDQQWASREIDSWNISACPMSSAALVAHDRKMLGAWETAGQIRAGWISERGAAPITLAAKNAKHPSITVNQQGHILIVWAEGTGWNRGGSVAWQECDQELKPIGPPGQAAGVPVWGKAAAYAEAQGDFVILR